MALGMLGRQNKACAWRLRERVAWKPGLLMVTDVNRFKHIEINPGELKVGAGDGTGGFLEEWGIGEAACRWRFPSLGVGVLLRTS